MSSGQIYDAIICGAGPAGMICALYLARANRKVLVLEKARFPRTKTCADNKTWKCLDIVRDLGLWNEFEKLPKAAIRGVLIASPSGYEIDTPLLESDIESKGTWYNVPRKAFDNMLADACKNQPTIVFREDCTVTNPIYSGGGRGQFRQMVGVNFVNERGKPEAAYGCVIVGAEGSSSTIANSAGLSPVVKGRYAINARAYYSGVSDLRDRCELYYLKGICPGYFWIFPVGDGLCNVGIGMRKEDLDKQGLTSAKLHQKLKEIIQTPKFACRFKSAKMVGGIGVAGLSVLGVRRPCSGPGFVLVGDAGTFAMTFSGEGVGPGMRSGKIAAESIIKCLDKQDFSSLALKVYDDSMWKMLSPEISGFKWLEFLLLHEKIFDFVVRHAASKPSLIELSSRMQRDYSASREIFSISTLAKFLLG